MKQKINTLTVIIINAVLLFMAALFLFPVFIMVSNSLMNGHEIVNRYTAYVTPENVWDAVNNFHFVNLSLIPDFVTFKQYISLLLRQPLYLGLFWNSVKIALPIVLGQALISAPAAYAFEMSNFKLKEAVYFIYIVVMLMPLQVALVPNYIVADFLGLDGSVWAIILPGMVNPFGVFLIRQYLKSLQKEYIEAAQIDGAGHLRIIFYVVMPLFKSAAAALAILTFIENWNLVEQPLIFLKESYQEPLSVYLSQMAAANLDMIFAASCFYMLPTVLIFLYGQEYMVEGIQLSGIK